jgi:hypothetical protein
MLWRYKNYEVELKGVIKIIVSIFLGIFFLGTLLIASNLSKGKWLRFIAGNTFPVISRDKQVKLGKIVGRAFYMIAIFILSLIIIINIKSISEDVTALLIGISTIIFVFIPAIYCIKEASKIK